MPGAAAGVCGLSGGSPSGPCGRCSSGGSSAQPIQSVGAEKRGCYSGPPKLSGSFRGPMNLPTTELWTPGLPKHGP